jgi:hypothetical protein
MDLISNQNISSELIQNNENPLVTLYPQFKLRKIRNNISLSPE